MKKIWCLMLAVSLVFSMTACQQEEMVQKETEQETPADGVITGYGTIGGCLVYVYSQDASVLGGSMGEMHAKKICSIYSMAMKMGAPVIGLVDCADCVCRRQQMRWMALESCI